jgi:hypothetical protein
LVSTYTNAQRKNIDVDDFYLHGRMLNMEKFPFFFPKPIELIVEGCTEGNGEFADKSLGLWKLHDINLMKIQLSISISAFFRFSIKIWRKVRSFK